MNVYSYRVDWTESQSELWYELSVVNSTAHRDHRAPLGRKAEVQCWMTYKLGPNPSVPLTAA